MHEVFFCQRVSPLALDALWAAGWRHFGQHFFRYDRLEHGNQALHVLPLRLRPAAFAPSRSQRRVLRRNADLTLRVGPAFVNDAALELFERHKTRFSHSVQMFEPAEAKRSLGVLMILQAIHLSGRSGKAFSYPGYDWRGNWQALADES